MEATIKMPSLQGQICKIINPLADENPEDVYIISEDPTPFEFGDSIYVTNLKDLQRNLSNPQFTPQMAINKGDLKVIADDLESYVSDLNMKEIR